MLVGQDNFVKIHGNGDLIILEVAKPSPMRAYGVCQKWNHLCKGDANCFTRRLIVQNFVVWSAKNAKIW